MAFPPEGFLIGAQKAGTTTLAALLDQHPNIVLSNPKEPDYFTLHWEKGLDWYRRCFPSSEGTLIDASVSYSMAASKEWDEKRELDVPRRIHEASPNARLIYVVRDPAERCYSAYWHEVRARGEKRSLREAVRQRAYFTMGSYYSLQIGRYLPYFPIERFLILRFEDVIHHPAAAARRCASFLRPGCADYAFEPERARNRGFRYNRGAESLRWLFGARAFDRITKAGSEILPVPLRTLARSLVTKDLPTLGDEDRAWMYTHYADDMAAFERLTGVPIIAATGACDRPHDTR